MGRITGQLRNFARKSSGQSAPVPLCHALDNALALLDARIRRAGAEVERSCPVDEPVALCDANRLEQVLINLIGNALDAMADQPRPHIDLRWECAGGMVRLHVRDHGPGLSDEAQAKLFEPFFTTKPQGSGLGLGLTLSASLAAAANGTLQAQPLPQGAAFVLQLPLCPEQELHHV